MRMVIIEGTEEELAEYRALREAAAAKSGEQVSQEPDGTEIDVADAASRASE
jgi:hypothetical protein